MEAVILKTVSMGTIDYTSGIMKDRVENFYNIFDNYETRSHSPFMGNGSSLKKPMVEFLAGRKRLQVELGEFLDQFKYAQYSVRGE